MFGSEGADVSNFPRGQALLVAAAIAVAFAAVGVWAPIDAHACPVCWDSSDDLMSRAMNWSIFFLMAMPFTIVGSIGGWLVYKYRRASRAERRQQALGQPVSTTQLRQKEIG